MDARAGVEVEAGAIVIALSPVPPSRPRIINVCVPSDKLKTLVGNWSEPSVVVTPPADRSALNSHRSWFNVPNHSAPGRLGVDIYVEGIGALARCIDVCVDDIVAGSGNVEAVGSAAAVTYTCVDGLRKTPFVAVKGEEILPAVAWNVRQLRELASKRQA